MRKLISSFLFIVFFVSAYEGYVSGEVKIIEELGRFFGEFEKILDDPFKFAVFIFLNNAVKSLIAMLSGFFFGIFPILFIAVNGYILGMVVALRLPEWGWVKIAAAILPHGIIEIPAVVLACSQGVMLGYRFYLAVFKGEKFKPHLMESLRVYFRIVVPMLLIAAVVEAFITFNLVKKLT
ncbi:MAG: stage II sporulation protein M [Archaeoglobales archaeon]|nr:stage II sporulation protein M [Archaeoglobales archaeon]